MTVAQNCLCLLIVALFSSAIGMGDEELAREVFSASTKTGTTPTDFNGLRLRAVYDSWPPFLVVKEDGNVSGIFYEVFSSVAGSLNVQVEYVPNENRGVWGMKMANGTWNGLMGMVEDGKAEAIIAGGLITSLRTSTCH